MRRAAADEPTGDQPMIEHLSTLAEIVNRLTRCLTSTPTRSPREAAPRDTYESSAGVAGLFGAGLGVWRWRGRGISRSVA